MRKLFFVAAAVISIIVVSCTGGKQLTTQVKDGEAAFQSGDYQKALTYWEEVIKYYEDAGKQKECPVYFEAASAAQQLGQSQKTIDYLIKDTYSKNVSAETYFELAKYYQSIDNLSKELESLETYITKFPNDENIQTVKTRLFEIYVESKNWDMAVETWPSLLPAAAIIEHLVESYFITNEALDNDSLCGVLAQDLLTMNDHNKIALSYMGKKYFWQAENRYKDEMEAYEKNKTNRQYNKLIKALDVVSADFKTSLGYFLKLYDIEPSSRNAKYIGDIYNRLDDKKKADLYYSRSNG